MTDTPTRRVKIRRTYLVQREEIYTADVPATWHMDEWLVNDFSKLDQWLCDNHDPEHEDYSTIDDDQLDLEVLHDEAPPPSPDDLDFARETLGPSAADDEVRHLAEQRLDRDGREAGALVDALGVEIQPGDTVTVIAWGDPVRLTDTGRQARVVSFTPAGNVLLADAHHPLDPIARGRAVSPGLLAVARRDGRPGHEGNRIQEAP